MYNCLFFNFYFLAFIIISSEKLGVFFNKWAIIAKQSSPMRKKCRQGAEELFVAKLIAWQKRVFKAMKDVLIGRFSTKQRIMDRRRLLENIRRDLSAKLLDQVKLFKNRKIRVF